MAAAVVKMKGIVGYRAVSNVHKSHLPILAGVVHIWALEANLAVVCIMYTRVTANSFGFCWNQKNDLIVPSPNPPHPSTPPVPSSHVRGPSSVLTTEALCLAHPPAVLPPLMLHSTRRWFRVVKVCCDHAAGECCSSGLILCKEQQRN